MAWWQWLVVVAILGCGGFLLWNRKQQAAKGGGHPKQRGIIK